MKYLIDRRRIMSNFAGHNPLVGPDGKLAKAPKFTLAYRDAMAHRAAFNKAYGGEMRAGYEVVCGVPRAEEVSLFLGMMELLDNELMRPSWFIVPTPTISLQEDGELGRKAVEYFRAGFDIADRLYLLDDMKVSILPAGWKNHCQKPLTLKEQAAWRDNTTQNLIDALDSRNGRHFSLLIETLSGYESPRSKKALELPYYNYPSQLKGVLDVLYDRFGAGVEVAINHVIDHAHICYGVKSLEEAIERYETEVIPLVQQGQVPQMHLSMLKTRGRAIIPKGVKASASTRKSTQLHIEIIRWFLARLRKDGIAVPEHAWEAFLPANFQGLLKLAETGLRPGKGPEYAIEFFNAVDPGCKNY